MSKKAQIIKLFHQKKTYRQIQKIVGCSLGTIAFHCGKGQKQKYYANRQKARAEFRIAIKQEAGGKCKECSYNKCFDALEFHHPDPNKEKGVSELIHAKGFEAARREAKKCVLLCANCHREEHHRLKSSG